MGKREREVGEGGERGERKERVRKGRGGFREGRGGGGGGDSHLSLRQQAGSRWWKLPARYGLLEETERALLWYPGTGWSSTQELVLEKIRIFGRSCQALL